ncbi:MAG: U32 family peptidase [Opitutaceae bacterium]|nr:U32 family peptidase [Opitutaceae bacterium]
MPSAAHSTAAGAGLANPLRRPEILAPAGDWECMRAAIENGADAIYFGLERFNARMRAHNFTVADLPRLMAFLHRRGVRGYVTFNTLVFADELAEAEAHLKTIIAAGADAAIVQDVGICRLIRALSPDFPIHCSTQMTITSAAGVDFARDLGAQLVVLARENSLNEIAAIQAAQTGTSRLSPGASPLPLEVFVHGALCVAYSGQCLTSESLGGRSANRGECAQACRMPYELVVDGRLLELGDRRYLLSPQDLASLDVLPDLVRLGVASLKIEGRLKSPEYVANITRAYRRALDRIMGEVESDQRANSAQGTETAAAAETKLLAELHQEFDYDLQMGFSRGLYTGWFGGTNNQELVHARFGTKRGVFLGLVSRITGESVSLRLASPIKPGDGIVFDAGRPDEKEEGGRVYQVEPRNGEAVLRFGRGDIDFSRLHIGDRVWKTNDPELDRRLRQTYANGPPRFRRDLNFEVHGRAGTPLTLIGRDELGHVAQAESALPLTPADTQPLTVERLTEQLGRLGGTPFKLASLKCHLEGQVILPVRELNALRRRAVADLEAQRAAPKRWRLNSAPAGASRLAREASRAGSGAGEPDPGSGKGAPELIVVMRQLDQLEAAWSAGARTIYCEFEDPKHYRSAVARFRELQAGHAPANSGQPQSSIWVAPPRIHKPGDEWILEQVRSSAADGYLVRNHDHLRFFAGDRRRGDFSLNVANVWSADYFIRHHGLERVTASYDLNISQLDGLLQSAPPGWFDITIHQHMPMFHMEHCVFCAFLTSGKDYHDCGRPCDRHDLRLRDRIGAEHPVKADAGCRNTVYNSRAQTGAEFVSHLLALGARSFRIDFLNEGADELRRTVMRYRQLLDGEISGAEIWRELKLLNQLGVTRGQLEAPARILPRKGT